MSKMRLCVVEWFYALCNHRSLFAKEAQGRFAEVPSWTPAWVPAARISLFEKTNKKTKMARNKPIFNARFVSRSSTRF